MRRIVALLRANSYRSGVFSAAAPVSGGNCTSRAGNNAHTARLSSSSSTDHSAISSSVRPQPMQWPLGWCITQTFLHGLGSMALRFAPRRPPLRR